jgi:polyhydroxyalkanoate synthesis regulator phasin
MADTALPERIVSEDAERAYSLIGAAIQQSWWLGLGLLATVGEQTARVADALVQKGREVEPAVLRPVKRAASSVSEATEGASAQLRRIAGDVGNVRIPAVLRGAARPTREEFDKLVEEIKDLRARLEEKIQKAVD